MTSDLREFWVPRRGNRSEEYEDAFATNVKAGRFAVADGATESSFAALWARLLVENFVQDAAADSAGWQSRLPDLQKQWYASVWRPDLPWNVEDKLLKGAFSTFLGVVVTFAPGNIPQWNAAAVGDTCLFHTRGPILFSASPLNRSNKFNNSPRLLGSRTSLEQIGKNVAVHIQGSGLPGDRLWMMTDALAQWCLKECENGGDPWAEIDAVLAPPEPRHQFAAWIDEIRASRELHNDDVTLLAITL
jgi:hypothetical protein